MNPQTARELTAGLLGVIHLAEVPAPEKQARKALRDAARGTPVYLLAPSHTHTDWYQRAFSTARATLLLSGDTPTTIFCFGGPSVALKFREHFRGHGVFVCAGG